MARTATRRLLLLIGLLATVTAACAESAGDERPAAAAAETEAEAEPEAAAEAEAAVLGWVPYWDQSAALASYRAAPERFDFVGLFWYRLTPEGEIEPYAHVQEDRALIRSLQADGSRVLGVIANLPDDDEGGTWDPARVRQAIGDPDARREHVRALLRLTDRMGLDGINIDYEALGGDQREAFSLFIEELGAALHAEGKLLGVSLHPKTGPNRPEEQNGSQAQDWARLARVADQLYLMTINEHWPGSHPGPLASTAWVEDVLRYAVEDVGAPPERIFLQLPLFGERWRESAGETHGVQQELTLRRIAAIAAEPDAIVGWDEAAHAPFLRRPIDGGEEIIWFENRDSLIAKIEVARRFGVTNVAIWRLGAGTPGLLGELATALRAEAVTAADRS